MVEAKKQVIAANVEARVNVEEYVAGKMENALLKV